MADCAFCEIVHGVRDAAVVHETDASVSFLDHRPVFPGHVLVVPRIHLETIEDLPPDTVGQLFPEVQRTATAVRVAMDAQGTFIAANNVVSQSVPTSTSTWCRVASRTACAGSSGHATITRMPPTWRRFARVSPNDCAPESRTGTPARKDALT